MFWKEIMFKINLFAFIIAFAFGIGYCYMMSPPPKVVVRFPSPANAGSIVYQDNAKNCFTFDAKETACSKDAISQPINVEEDFRGSFLGKKRTNARGGNPLRQGKINVM
jgi:hypothetical protein